jgi:LPS-assembly protein
VVFNNPEGHLSAESIDFNLDDQTGTFHKAAAIMTVPKADRAQFGNQDPDVYFFGETIEKIGARRYRITNGGFTTCVQPTPRWEMVSDSAILNLNDYAIARNTVLKVKGVPLFYLPVVYYPIRNQDRATGFLLPTYGASTVRGQSISNAFFWAIDRSQDATFFHDWFTRTGQGIGGEYRYVSDAQSSGNLRVYRFAQKQATYTQLGSTTTLPESTVYQVTSAVTQQIGRSMRAQVNVDYFSNIFLQQLYHQNLYQATQGQRRIAGGLTEAHGPLSAGFYYSRSEYFSSNNVSSVYGNTPRITAAIAPQRLFGTPVYASLNTEYSYLPNRFVTAGVTTSDTSMGRVDIAPAVRAPLSKLTFLTVNTTAGFRSTIYSRELDATGQLVPGTLAREYFSTRTELIGPVFTKIWDTPDSQSIQRMKHVIEPGFAVDYVSSFSNQASVPTVTSDPADYVVGGAMRFTYGLTNRLLYRERPRDGRGGATREFMSIAVQQTYYDNPQSSRHDPTYVTSLTRSDAVTLSPVALVARVSPNTAIDSNTRIEYDVNGNGLQSFMTGARLTIKGTASNLNYSRQRATPTSPVTSFMTGSSTLNARQWRGTYSLSWDLARAYIVSQSVIGTYMAQCCGIQFELQEYHFPANSGYPVTSDRRFNFGFVLAGLGTFSNFFGAFGGMVR